MDGAPGFVARAVIDRSTVPRTADVDAMSRTPATVTCLTVSRRRTTLETWRHVTRSPPAADRQTVARTAIADHASRTPAVDRQIVARTVDADAISRTPSANR